jgi:tRNA1(Val) A37 N6-methylase TrmN6
MNPPFNDPTRQRASPDRQRRLAHAGSNDTLRAWIKTAARLLRPRGMLSVICRADRLAELLQALAPAFGAATVLPVYPGERQPAVRVLVRATKASRGPLVLLPGLILNGASGRPTAQAEAVLRGDAVLPLSES